MDDGGRKLSVFFTASGTRYVVEAVGVLEVARTLATTTNLHGNLELADFSELLGGPPLELQDPSTAIVFDSSPTLATRVNDVEGVFAAGGLPSLPLSRRLVSMLAPVVRGAVLHEQHLYFDVDPDAVVRGLPPQTRALDVETLTPTGPCLVFKSGFARFAVPLPSVKQVILSAPTFNRVPSPGACVGVVAHQGGLFPVYTLTRVPSEPLVVLVETATETVGLCAHRADGLRPPDGLGEAQVLDLARMFS